MASSGTQTYLVVIEHRCESWGADCPDLLGLAWCPAPATVPSS